MFNLPKMPLKGMAAIPAIMKCLGDIVTFLRTLDIRGDGKYIKINKSPTGTLISFNTDNLPRTFGGAPAGEEVPTVISDRRYAKYFNNVCRLSQTGTADSLTMDLLSATNASLFTGNFQYNINGLYNYIPSAMTALSTITSGTPRMNTTRTWEIGLQFDLTMTEIPSAQVFNSYKSPYYWEWSASMQSREVRLNRNNIPSSGTLSSHFVPISYLSLSSTQPYVSGMYDIVLENVNQCPTLMTQIDPAFVRMVDSYTPPPDGN